MTIENLWARVRGGCIRIDDCTCDSKVKWDKCVYSRVYLYTNRYRKGIWALEDRVRELEDRLRVLEEKTESKLEIAA